MFGVLQDLVAEPVAAGCAALFESPAFNQPTISDQPVDRVPQVPIRDMLALPLVFPMGGFLQKFLEFLRANELGFPLLRAPRVMT